MATPRIDLVPYRAAVRVDAPTTLDILVRITPPMPEIHFVRPTLNIALVLDRSGSMAGGSKMKFAREAAEFVVGQLLPTDRVSVTIFDDQVETIVPNTPVEDKPGIIRALGQATPRGSTALHAGWSAGAAQAASAAVAGINRVMLLSDGLANVGVTEPTAIAADVRGELAKGVGTTTLGVGVDYNEDLMEAIAGAGDGNYYFIESAAQLADIFQTELHGLMATSGQKVSLGLEPRSDARVVDVLNDFDKAPTGNLMLPNLVVGMPLEVIVRVHVPARAGVAEVLGVRLAWDEPRGASGRQVLHETLTLPAVASAAWETLPIDPAVQDKVALLMSARAKKEAQQTLQRGDIAGTRIALASARKWTMSASAPAQAEELADIALIEAGLEEGDYTGTAKLAHFQSYRRRKSKNDPA